MSEIVEPEVGSRWYEPWTYSMAVEYRGSGVIDGVRYYAWARLRLVGVELVASPWHEIERDLREPSWAPRIPLTPEIEQALVWNLTHETGGWVTPPGCARRDQS